MPDDLKAEQDLLDSLRKAIQDIEGDIERLEGDLSSRRGRRPDSEAGG